MLYTFPEEELKMDDHTCQATSAPTAPRMRYVLIMFAVSFYY